MMKNTRFILSVSARRREFEKLYDEYSGRIYGFAMQLSGGDTYLSEEILQITFLRLWEHFEDLRDKTKALNYMFQTARNTFINYCEHETVRFVYTDYILTRQQEADNHDEQQQDAHFLEEYLREIVAKMPPMRRKVFVMSRYRHLSNKEIAKQLGISEKTVEVHITLALRELRERLND
ncbi:MAG: RNA polymerase sigma-70 factor [Paludibacteraceae bacterium]|nr:RNA polymerase sigma-70 factor [Paludibacteraceae bacterium]